jgi:hypothetical protein
LKKLKGEVCSAKPYSPVDNEHLMEGLALYGWPSRETKNFRIDVEGFKHINMLCSDFVWDSVGKELRISIEEVPMMRGLEFVDHLRTNKTAIELELRTSLKKPYVRIHFDGALLLSHELKPMETASFCGVEHFVVMRYDSCTAMTTQEDNDAAKIPPQLRERFLRSDGTSRSEEYGRD